MQRGQKIQNKLWNKDRRTVPNESENWSRKHRISCEGDKASKPIYFLLVSLYLVVACCVGATKSLARLKSRTWGSGA